MVEVRARARPAPPPTLATPLGYPVIGGPRAPEPMPQGAVWPQGTFHCLEGRPIKVWPWRTGSDIIGIIYHEYKHVPKDGWVFVTTHIYELHERTWRYMGKAASWSDARIRLENQHERRRNEVAAVQPVAVRARTRPNV